MASFEDFARHLAVLEGWTLSDEQRAYCRAVDHGFSRTLVISPGRRLGLRWLAQAYEQYRMHEDVNAIADVVERLEWDPAWNCARMGHVWLMCSDRCHMCDAPADPPDQLSLDPAMHETLQRVADSTRDVG